MPLFFANKGTSVAGNLLSHATLNLAGGDNITLSQAGTHSITIFMADALQGLGISGNTSGQNAALTGAVYLHGGNNITLSGAGDNAITVYGADNSNTYQTTYFDNLLFLDAANTFGTSNVSTMIYWFPLLENILPTLGGFNINTLNIDWRGASAATNSTGSMSFGIAFYGVGTNSSLSKVLEASSTFSFTSGASNFSSVSGFRWITFGSAAFTTFDNAAQPSLTPGIYWVRVASAHRNYSGCAFVGHSGTAATSLLNSGYYGAASAKMVRFPGYAAMTSGNMTGPVSVNLSAFSGSNTMTCGMIHIVHNNTPL